MIPTSSVIQIFLSFFLPHFSAILVFQLGKVWGDIQPIIDNLHGASVSARTSPIGSPVNNHTGITV